MWLQKLFNCFCKGNRVEKSEMKYENVLISAVCGCAKDTDQIKESSVYGDDCWFCASTNEADVIGIADGVGSWHSKGIDVSKFAMSLMKNCENLVNSRDFEVSKPGALIEKGFEQMHADNVQLHGSTTACVVVYDKAYGKLHSANIGDSGYLIIRNGKVKFQSKMQFHRFNLPYQLAILPEGYYQKFSSTPNIAELQTNSLQPDDIVLVATDGLFDNLSVDEIVSIIRWADQADTSRQLFLIVQNLVDFAKKRSVQNTIASPFEIRAKLNNKIHRGGKPDDITAILAKVVLTAPKPALATLYPGLIERFVAFLILALIFVSASWLVFVKPY